MVIVFSIGSLEEPQRRHHRRQRARKTRNSFSYDRKSRKRSRLDRVILARRCCDLPCSTSWKGNLPRDFRKKIARSQREALTLMQNLTPVFRPLFRHKLAITVFSLGIAYVARTLIIVGICECDTTSKSMLCGFDRRRFGARISTFFQSQTTETRKFLRHSAFLLQNFFDIQDARSVSE